MAGTQLVSLPLRVLSLAESGQESPSVVLCWRAISVHIVNAKWFVFWLHFHQVLKISLIFAFIILKKYVLKIEMVLTGIGMDFRASNKDKVNIYM